MYTGKFLDGFDYAVRLLFAQAGIPQIPSPDCISHRNLGFVLAGSPMNWFRPVLRWERYLPTLGRNLGCAEDIFYGPASSFPVEELPFPNSVLFGEVPLPASEQGIRGKFYHGVSGFLLCRRSKEGILFLHDPSGCPRIESTPEELLALLRGCDGFFLTLRRRPACQPAPKAALRREAVSLREVCTRALFADAAGFSDWNPSKKIALRYGLMHYQTQRTRSAEFYGFRPAFFGTLSEINRIFDSMDFKPLREAEEQYWSELCTAV